jgi:hypothetical protein
VKQLEDTFPSQQKFCVFQNKYKSAVKLKLVHKCRTNAYTLSANTCVQVYHYPKLFSVNSRVIQTRAVEDTLLLLNVMSCNKKSEH